MRLAIDKFAIYAFAICTVLELVNRRLCPVGKGSQILQLCRSVSSCPTSWQASTTPLVVLISRCLVHFALLYTTSHERVCSASPLPPFTLLSTSLSRIWFWCGAVSQWHTLWAMWMEPLLNSQVLESGRLVIAFKEGGGCNPEIEMPAYHLDLEFKGADQAEWWRCDWILCKFILLRHRLYHDVSDCSLKAGDN